MPLQYLTKDYKILIISGKNNVKLHIEKVLVKYSIKIYNKKKSHISCDIKTLVQMHIQSCF